MLALEIIGLVCGLVQALFALSHLAVKVSHAKAERDVLAKKLDETTKLLRRFQHVLHHHPLPSAQKDYVQTLLRQADLTLAATRRRMTMMSASSSSSGPKIGHRRRFKHLIPGLDRLMWALRGTGDAGMRQISEQCRTLMEINRDFCLLEDDDRMNT